MGAVEQRVEVGQQHVAQGERLPHGLLRRLAEPVRLLGLRGGRGAEGAPASGSRGPALGSGTSGPGSPLAPRVLAPSGPPPPSYQALQLVVVPHEGIKGPQLGPAHAQLLRRAAPEAADVRPHQGHPQQVEEQDLCREESNGAGSGPQRPQTCLLCWALAHGAALSWPPMWSDQGRRRTIST